LRLGGMPMGFLRSLQNKHPPLVLFDATNTSRAWPKPASRRSECHRSSHATFAGSGRSRSGLTKSLRSSVAGQASVAPNRPSNSSRTRNRGAPRRFGERTLRHPTAFACKKPLFNYPKGVESKFLRTHLRHRQVYPLNSKRISP
jgi:hypothetical protein